MEKLYDIIKILKEHNIPKGYTLYSPIAGDIKLSCMTEKIIVTQDKFDNTHTFNVCGKYMDFEGNAMEHGEVMLFPDKYMRDWSCFSSLYVMRNFHTGDIISFWEDGMPTAVGIVKQFEYNKYNNVKVIDCSIIAGLDFCGNFKRNTTFSAQKLTFAAEDEKERLFRALKEHGYQWNEEKKIIEQIKYDWKTFKGGLDFVPVLALENNIWVVRKLIKVEPYTNMPFTCKNEIGVEIKYKYCMPYNDETYLMVFNSEPVKAEYDISI